MFFYIISLLIGYLSYWKYFRKISIVTAIRLLRLKLISTEIYYIQIRLPEKYCYDYWLNVILMNIVYVEDSSSVDIRNLNQQQNILPKKISIRKVNKYIKRILREQKQYKSGIIEKLYGPCDHQSTRSDIIELKTINELENNLPGTVVPNDPNMNKKLKIDVGIFTPVKKPILNQKKAKRTKK